MSRANLTTVRRMVYENLGITEGNYGTPEVNQRYPSGYVDDAIAGADLTVMKTLLKSKQYHFTNDFFSVLPIPSKAPIALPPNTELLTVIFNNGDEIERGVEIPWEMYEMFTEPLEGPDLFEFEGNTTKKYGGYFSIKDHYLYTIPFSDTDYITIGQPKPFTRTEYEDTGTTYYFDSANHGLTNGDIVLVESTGTLPAGIFPGTTYYVVNSFEGDFFNLSLSSGGSAIPLTTAGTGTHYVTEITNQNVGLCKYIALSHPSALADLKSPQSFEEAIAFLASANLLMKRANNPEQAGFYMQQYQMLMGLYMSPSTNQSRTIDQ